MLRSMFLKLLPFCAALGFSPTVAAANDQVTTFSLDNGMEVVVIEDHRAQAGYLVTGACTVKR